MLTHRGLISWVIFSLLTLTALTPACDAWWHREAERKDAIPVTSQSSGIDGPRKDGVLEDDVSKDSAGSGLFAAASGGGEDAGSAKQCQDCVLAPVISIRVSTRARTAEDKHRGLHRRGRHRSHKHRQRARQRPQRPQHGARPSGGGAGSSEGEDGGRPESPRGVDSGQLDRRPGSPRRPPQTLSHTLRTSRPPQHRQAQSLSHALNKQRDRHLQGDGKSIPDKESRARATAVDSDVKPHKSSKKRKTSERGTTAANTDRNSETLKPSSFQTKSEPRKKSSRKGQKKKPGKKSSKGKSSSRIASTLTRTNFTQKPIHRSNVSSSDTREQGQKARGRSLKKTVSKDNPSLIPQSVQGIDSQRDKTSVSNDRGDSGKDASRRPDRRRGQTGARRNREREGDSGREEKAGRHRQSQSGGGHHKDDAKGGKNRKSQTSEGHHKDDAKGDRNRKSKPGGGHHKDDAKGDRNRKSKTGGGHHKDDEKGDRNRKSQTDGGHHKDDAKGDKNRKSQTDGGHHKGDARDDKNRKSQTSEGHHKDDAMGDRNRKSKTGGGHHKDDAKGDRNRKSQTSGRWRDRSRQGGEGRQNRRGGTHEGARRHKGKPQTTNRDIVSGRQSVTDRPDGMRRDWGRRIGAERYYGARRRYGAGRYAFDVPSRPAAADRLEQRLFPSVTSSTRTLLRSMQRVLSTLSSGVQAVKDDNGFIFNGTRYVIMLGVRQQLKDIAKANDMVYETVLRASLLTKDIYLRAHQSRLTGPTTRSLARPEMNLPSLYEAVQAAYEEERLAKQALRSVQDHKRQRDQVHARLQQVREKFQDNFARNDLRTLVYYINSTSQRLSSELTYSTHAAYVKRNLAILYDSHEKLNVARDLLYKASNSLAASTDDYRGNYRVIQDWRHHRNDDDGVGAPVSIRRQRRSVSRHHHDQPMRELTAEERARLQPIIDRLKRHATEQKRLAMEVERVLRPAIERGRLITQHDDVAASARLSALASRLDRDGKKLYSLLDSIRVLIGGEQELRWVSALAACRDDEDDMEGSGCISEGSGGLVLEGGEEEGGSGQLPGITTDDEDFVFVDEKEQPRRRGPTPLAKFGHQLSVYVDGVKLRSNDILQRGDQLYETTEALTRRWSDVKRNYDAVGQAHRKWKQTKQIMQNVTRFADDVSKLVGSISERIDRSHDSIKSRMAKAVAIAERKLAEAQAQKAGGDGAGRETEVPASDDTAMLEAVEKVQKVRKERDVVRSLRAVTPQSCGRASLQIMRLHSNISHLRQQVNTAKALLQSMQLSISKSGSGYLSIPVSQKAPTPSSPRLPSLPPSLSLVTTVEVCIKTQDTDGPVLLVKGNNSATFSLSIDSRQVSVTVYNAEGNNLDTVTSDVTMEENMWYNVKVTRTGKKVLLQVAPRDATGEPVENDVVVSSMRYLQPTPLHVYVGGVADNEPFSVGSDTWRGCLGELYVNGRAVSLVHETSTGEGPQMCATQCSWHADGSSLIFDGISFLHFPASVLPMRRRMQSVHLRFRTRQATAALLHLVNQRQRFMLRVVLASGALMIDTTTPTESITLRSQSNSYNDGVFHSLKIQYRDSTTYPEIDGIDGAFTIEKSRPQNLNKMADGVVVGAFVTGSHTFEKSKYKPLIGCLQELEIDGRPLSMSQAVTSVGVFSGTCDSHTVWSQCVQFEEDSTGIELGTLDHSATVVLLFSLTARGPLLTYAREGKFEAEIAASEDGLQVTTEEDELTIPRPDDVTAEFSMLTVTDDGKVVRYSAWGEEVETTYGGFWDGRSDVEGEHAVQLGLSSDPASDRQLFGQIAQLMVGDRFIDLTSYSLQNKLASCERPLPDLVMSETVPEVTTSSSEDVESTCSRDIQC